MGYQKFKQVWYLPDDKMWVPFIRDCGSLTVFDDKIVFHGKKTNLVLTNIFDASLYKLGWVKIQSDNPPSQVVLFADGRLCGLMGALGGTNKILSAVNHFMQNQGTKNP